MVNSPGAATPPDADVPRYAELMITLPPDWKLDKESFEDERWYWPVRLIKTLARLPHKYGTWLGWGHTVPNGDPAEPYAADVRFDGCILLPSISVPAEFHRLRIDGDKEIAFLAIVTASITSTFVTRAQRELGSADELHWEDVARRLARIEEALGLEPEEPASPTSHDAALTAARLHSRRPRPLGG